MRTFAIIPAGGKGSRTGVRIPKQYLKVSGKEIIVYTLQNFQKCKLIDEIVISAEPEYFKLLENLKKKYRLNKISKIVEGGKKRQDSVFSALTAINAEKSDLILVHDAARPLISADILENALILAKKKGNAVVCLKARDTLVYQNSTEHKYLDRENIYYIQTPQIFTYSILMNAMNRAFENNLYATDESIIVSANGEKINFVEGSSINLKITTFEDISILRKFLK